MTYKISYTFIVGLICILGSLYTSFFFHLNDIIKVADSFAYFQMSHFLQSLSIEWFWNGWFGFLYSLPIAAVNYVIHSEVLAARIVNIILLNISALLLWKVSRKILSQNWSYIVLILFFIHPTLLHFRIHILSENIYIPLFLSLFLSVIIFIENIHSYKKSVSQTILIACLIWLMYLTRAEAFIYIGSIGIIALSLMIKWSIDIKKFLSLGVVFFITFFLFISPYLFFLHSLTWEWWLTNKWASNLRQAELRGQEQMDDSWFERAVAELTSDNKHLIAGFAGWMPYSKPSIEWSLKNFILKDPTWFIDRILWNQKKLYTTNFSELFLGKSPQLYHSNDTRFSHLGFLVIVLIPIFIFLHGLRELYKKQKKYFGILLSFFIPACLFFTLFFTLNRYFLIFIPFLILIFCYGASQRNSFKYTSILSWVSMICYISLLLLSTFVYYNTESPKDSYYELKKEAGVWLFQNIENPQELKIMERFPIVTYYSDSKIRYITPYTSNIEDIYEYGLHNDIDILIADSMDFQTYRPELSYILSKTPDNFKLLKEFTNSKEQKVILYKLKK